MQIYLIYRISDMGGRDTQVENHCSDPGLFTPSLSAFSGKASISPDRLTVLEDLTCPCYLPGKHINLTLVRLPSHLVPPKHTFSPCPTTADTCWPLLRPPTLEPHHTPPKLLLKPVISMKSALPHLGPAAHSWNPSAAYPPSLPWPCLFPVTTVGLLVLQAFQTKKLCLAGRRA